MPFDTVVRYLDRMYFLLNKHEAQLKRHEPIDEGEEAELHEKLIQLTANAVAM